MIIKVILDTNQEVEIYDSSVDTDLVTIAYRQVMNVMTFSIYQSVSKDLPVYKIWNKLSIALKESEGALVKSIKIINDDNEVIFEKDDIINYLYSVTFNHPLSESIDFEFAE